MIAKTMTEKQGALCAALDDLTTAVVAGENADGYRVQFVNALLDVVREAVPGAKGGAVKSPFFKVGGFVPARPVAKAG